MLPPVSAPTLGRGAEKRVWQAFVRLRSAESFCALFKLFYPQVRRYFLARGVDEMGAEELAQNTLLVVYQRIGDLRDQNLFCGWLFKIARNELLQHVRQQQRRNRIAEFEPLSDELAGKLHKAGNRPNFEIEGWLSQLEPAEREIVMLRFVEGLSYEELAVALAVPLGTVKWRIFNARKKLAQLIPVGIAQSPTSIRLKAVTV